MLTSKQHMPDNSTESNHVTRSPARVASADALERDCLHVGVELWATAVMAYAFNAHDRAPALEAWLGQLNADAIEVTRAVKGANTAAELGALQITVQRLKDSAKLARDWLEEAVAQAPPPPNTRVTVRRKVRKEVRKEVRKRL